MARSRRRRAGDDAGRHPVHPADDARFPEGRSDRGCGRAQSSARRAASGGTSRRDLAVRAGEEPPTRQAQRTARKERRQLVVRTHHAGGEPIRCDGAAAPPRGPGQSGSAHRPARARPEWTRQRERAIRFAGAASAPAAAPARVGVRSARRHAERAVQGRDARACPGHRPQSQGDQRARCATGLREREPVCTRRAHGRAIVDGETRAEQRIPPPPTKSLDERRTAIAPDSSSAKTCSRPRIPSLRRDVPAAD